MQRFLVPLPEYPPFAFHHRRENLTLNAAIQLREHESVTEVRALADQAFSRVAGAPLVEGNHVRLLKDARENYPAWLDAIGAAKRHIHFESSRPDYCPSILIVWMPGFTWVGHERIRASSLFYVSTIYISIHP